MINESGTMSGGGGKPRGGRMCLGNAAPRTLDTQAATAELAQAEQELGASQQVDHCARAAFICKSFVQQQKLGSRRWVPARRLRSLHMGWSRHGAAQMAPT